MEEFKKIIPGNDVPMTVMVLIRQKLKEQRRVMLKKEVLI